MVAMESGWIGPALWPRRVGGRTIESRLTGSEVFGSKEGESNVVESKVVESRVVESGATLRAQRRGRAAACVLLLALAGAGPASAGELLIRGPTVFDVERGRPYQADVLVRDGRIVRIARGLELPHGAQLVEAGGLALLPGLFDLHTHWTPAMQPSSQALVANAYLASGVTTLSDFHQTPESWQPRREWLSQLVAPRVLFAARMSTPLGHGADWADQATTKWVNSPEAARQAVRELVPYRPDVIKAFTDGWRYGRAAENTSMDGETLSALVQEAHAHRIKVLTHTVTVARARIAAEAGVDVIAHSLLDGPIDAATVAALKRAGTAYAPSLAVYEPVRVGEGPAKVAPGDPLLASRTRNFANAVHNLRKLHRGGVPVVLGTDAGMTGTPHGRASLRELELLVEAGLSPAQALRAGTVDSARALGREADLGTVAEGKIADLVLVEGRPWRDIGAMQRVRQVFLAGEPVFEDASRVHSAADSALPNTVAWPPPRPLPGPLLDDFERPDQRTALDSLRTGEADGGNDRSWQILQVVPRETGGHALQVSAVLSSQPAPYASVVFPLDRGSVVAVDLAGRRGLGLELRGNARTLALQLRGQDRRQWQLDLPPPGDGWTTLQLDLGTAREVDWRGQLRPGGVAWDGQPLLQVVLVARGDSRSQLWYELDNVRFH